MYTPKQWDQIAIALETKIESIADIFGLGCLHIPKALKLCTRFCSCKFRSLSQSFNDMTIVNLLAIAQDQFESLRLALCSQDFFIVLGFYFLA